MNIPKLTPADQKNLDKIRLKIKAAQASNDPVNAWYILAECRVELCKITDTLIWRSQ